MASCANEVEVSEMIQGFAAGIGTVMDLSGLGIGMRIKALEQAVVVEGAKTAQPEHLFIPLDDVKQPRVGECGHSASEALLYTFPGFLLGMQDCLHKHLPKGCSAAAKLMDR